MDTLKFTFKDVTIQNALYSLEQKIKANTTRRYDIISFEAVRETSRVWHGGAGNDGILIGQLDVNAEVLLHG